MRVGAQVLLGLLLAAPAASQSTGLLRFDGSGEIGTPAAFLFRHGPVGARLYLVLSPAAGSFGVTGFHTDCFGADPGMAGLLVALDQLGQADVPLPLPPDPSLVGTWLGSQAFALSPSFPRTNCATFMVIGPASGPSIVETFDQSLQAEPRLGRGRWAEPIAGTLLPVAVGGDGELGSFDPTTGTAAGAGVYSFSTDTQVFPGSHTLAGTPVTVADGVFRFLDFHVPAGVTVRLQGSRPARILVAGDAHIEGTLDVSAPALTTPAGSAGIAPGQPGGLGGPGGGLGGAGGDAPQPSGTPSGNPNGNPGDNLLLPAGNGHASAEDTGGAGSIAWPPGAEPASVTHGFFALYSNQMAGGGGGAGFRAPGSSGQTLAERVPTGGTGPHGAAGRALPAPAGERSAVSTSRDRHLVGGSGGGGGGVHPYDSIVLQPPTWVPGSGGGGGGGALLLAVAGDLTIAQGAAIVANGGDAASRTDLDGLLRAPGGGGSGGSVLFQVAGRFVNRGRIQAVGGSGGVTEDLRLTPGTSVAGGDGGDGYIRIETPAPRQVQPGVARPVPDVATLLDRDPQTIAVSLWYPLPSGPGPMGYELFTRQDGRTVAYSDRPQFGSGPTVAGSTPVVLFTRFCALDPSGVPMPGTTESWAPGAAAPVGAVDAVQFAIRFDCDVLGRAADVRVETLRLSF